MGAMESVSSLIEAGDDKVLDIFSHDIFLVLPKSNPPPSFFSSFS